MVNLADGKKPVGYKWVFTVKVNPDGSLAKLKSRLVAKIYDQSYRVNYLDTFSLVAKLSSIYLFMSLVVFENWLLHSWILRITSFMVILKRKCIWRNHSILFLKGVIDKYFI